MQEIKIQEEKILHCPVPVQAQVGSKIFNLHSNSTWNSPKLTTNIGCSKETHQVIFLYHPTALDDTVKMFQYWNPEDLDSREIALPVHDIYIDILDFFLKELDVNGQF